VLEFISVILEYCAALTVIGTEDFTDDPWPVFLARCDDKSGVRWISRSCMNSEIGRELGRFFCALLIDSRLGINADQKLSKSRRDKDITMQRSRQAFWIRWMEHLGKVPCNHSSKEHMALVTCFIESIIQGVSIKNKDQQ
jgi:hypothetical protein